MQVSPFSYHELNTNNNKTFQNQNFNFHKLCIHIITLYKWKYFSMSQTLPYILTKRILIKKLFKVYSSHGSLNNQKETKSHGCKCDFTINHKETISHGINQCIMTKLWKPTTQLTPLNNYLNNCVITSNYTSSYITFDLRFINNLPISTNVPPSILIGLMLS
jgi:hypothetical protein